MAELVAAFVVSTIGFSVFLYGKKQTRLPQLVGGLALMVVPLCGLSALVLALTSGAIAAAIAVAVRAGA